MTLRDIRTYGRLDIDLQPGLTVFAGPNGTGKTNALEACAIALMGASPRTSAELRCISHGATIGRIEAQVEVGGQRHTHAVVYDRTAGKRLSIDDTAPPAGTAFAAHAPAVAFLPEQLLAIRGAPARRRALLDRLVLASNPAARGVHRQYADGLRQRNNLLRRARNGADVTSAIAPWTAQVAQLGAQVREQRRAVLEQLSPRYAAHLSALTGMEDGAIDVVERGIDLEATLKEGWSSDVRRGSTTAGPHLDEVTPCSGARDLRTWGSTGEQRAALLAWAFAEADVLAGVTGRRPVLLLDEPYAELDADRRRRLTAQIAAVPQVLVTTTEPPVHLLDGSTPVAADIRRVSSGSIGPWITQTTTSQTSRS